MDNINNNNIRRILNEIDSVLEHETTFILCGGAASLLVSDISYSTGDIDLLYSKPKILSNSLNIKNIQEKFNLSDGWINDSAKGYISYLHPDFKSRIIEYGKFNKLKLYALSKPDIYTMKMVRGYPKDIYFLKKNPLDDPDKKIFMQNIEYMSKSRPDEAQKALLRSQEMGLFKVKSVNKKDIKNISELYQYIHQQGYKITPKVALDIKDKINKGYSFGETAQYYSEKKMENNKSKGIDI